MKNTIVLICGIALFATTFHAQTYPENDSGAFQDLLTPAYYGTPIGGAFRNEINKFVYHARQEPFQHPLEDSLGVAPTFLIPAAGSFSAGKGPTGTESHHKANDMHIVPSLTDVTLYASISGNATTFRNAPIYGDYLAITTDIKDSANTVLGKMVVIYGHIDLNLDSLDGLSLDGLYLNKGEIVSNHLHAATPGGPHLHYEIRYYRPGDMGTETYFGFLGGGLTVPSAGIWTYGSWNPSFGYGFAQLENHLPSTITTVAEPIVNSSMEVYPNPSTETVTLKMTRDVEVQNISMYNSNGQLIQIEISSSTNTIDISTLHSGVYYLEVFDKMNNRYTTKIIKE